VGASINIIQAEGSPPAQMSILIAIRVTAAICPSQPDLDTLQSASCFWASRGSLLVSKPGAFLPSSEGQGALR
jgi:hypothetical protein